ncbi:hypothetical protein [Streptomyces sp. NPDC094468]
MSPCKCRHENNEELVKYLCLSCWSGLPRLACRSRRGCRVVAQL